MNIPLSNPDISPEDIQAVVEVLKTPNLSLGPKLAEFEEQFAAYIGRKYAVAVNSGTSGLHLCVKALGLKEGDEVITTPFSFIASANSLLFEQVKPVFVDIKEETLNINEDKIEERITSRTKAILPVHVFGYPCNMAKINKIAKKHNLAVIEDSCEAIGAIAGTKKAGTFSDCAVFAFYPNKQMTTGEGGMIVTDSENIAKLTKSLRNQGRDDGMGWLAHNRLGYNYRLSDLNCALGVSQLNKIEEMLAKRANVAKLYNAKLGGIKELILPPQNSRDIQRSWFVYVVGLGDNFDQEQRDKIIKKMRLAGIGCSAYFPPIHLQPFYKDRFGYKKGDYPITENVAARTIALPFFNNLQAAEIEYVASKIKNIIMEVKKK